MLLLYNTSGSFKAVIYSNTLFLIMSATQLLYFEVCSSLFVCGGTDCGQRAGGSELVNGAVLNDANSLKWFWILVN